MGVKIGVDSKSKTVKADSLPSEKPEDAGEALERVLDYAGPMGRYQRWLFLAMLPFGIGYAFVNFVTIFTVATPENYWCHVPELEHLDLELRRNLSALSTAKGDWNRCSTYEANWTSVLETLQPPHPDTPQTDSCPDGWVFQFEDVPYETVVTQRNWVCDSDNYVPMIQISFFVGAFVGGVLFGWVADTYGIVPAIVAVNLVGFIGALSSIFTNSFWDFMVCRFIAGMSYDNCFMLVYILVLEYVGAKYRTWVANLSIMFYYGGGCMVLPWLALWILDWRILTAATAAPLLFALVAPFVFPESARWLSSRGQNDRAVKMLRRLERLNGTEIPDDAMDDFIALSASSKNKEENLRVMVSNPRLLVLLIVLIALFTTNVVVFDVLSRLSGSLGMDMYIAFTLASATEVPSILLVIYLLNRLGRRMTGSGSTAVVSILCIVAAFVGKGIALSALAISARFFMNMAFNTTIQWTAELLPSSARAASCSVVHVLALLLSSPSPYIVYLEGVWGGLPFLIIGCISMVALLINVILPETLNHALPHNCADSERLIIQDSLLGKIMRISRSKTEDDEFPQTESREWEKRTL